MSDHVIVVYNCANYSHCIMLMKIWPQIVEALTQENPQLRFVVVTSPSGSGEFDETVFPKGLRFYNEWHPMIILVPGKLWNSAMEQLGPDNPVELKEGVKIMNGTLIDDKITFNGEYDKRNVEEILRWYKNATRSYKFKKTTNF